MSDQLFIQDTTTNKISYYHLAAFLVLLPFDIFYSELVLISFGIHTLISIKRHSFPGLLSKPVLLIASLFLVNLVGLLYSPDKKEAVNVMTRQLAILLFPAFFTLNGLDLTKYKLPLLRIFGFTCAGVVLYLYLDTFRTMHYFGLPFSSILSPAFMNHNFSLPLGLHATYLSMYISLAICIFLLLVLQQNTKHKWIYFLSLVVLAAGLIQLASRSCFIALLIIVNIIFPFFISPLKKKMIFIGIVVLLSVGTLLAIFKIEAFKTRYISELKTDLAMQPLNSELTEPRAKRWDIVLALVKRSPIIGYGAGSEKELLKEKYFEQHLYISYLNEFNSHSQYLSFLLKYGIAGLLLYGAILGYALLMAWRKRDALFLCFIALVCVVSFSENILDMNKGIFFFSFFIAFFLLPYSRLNDSSSISGRQPAAT